MSHQSKLDMQQHEAFFSFTVPANDSSAPEPRTDDHNITPVAPKNESNEGQCELGIVTQTDRPALPRTPSGSISPATLGDRPGTANQYPFTFPSTSNSDVKERTSIGGTEDVSPVSGTSTGFPTDEENVRRNSRQGLTILTGAAPAKLSQRACLLAAGPSPLGMANPESPAERSGDYPSHDIGTHNTRPMTAPGAGWAAGNYNHGYDYSSASAGLFGDGGYHNSSGRTSSTNTDGSNNTTSTHTSPAVAEPKNSEKPTKPSLQALITVNSVASRKSSMNQSIAPDQGQSSLLSLTSQLTPPGRQCEPTPPGQLMYSSASPTLHSISLPPDQNASGSPYLHSSSSQQPYHIARPNTHAGTSASFGERPDSSYGPPTPLHSANSPTSPFALTGYSANSRPGTANAAVNVPMYGASYANSRPGCYGIPRLNIPSSNPSQPPSNSSSPVYGNVRMISNGSDHSHGNIQQSSLIPTNNQTNPYGVMSSHPMGSVDAPNRMYNFNMLPVAPRKRARRRYDEIERLYSCSYPGCTKAYGTLNHLNAHITMQKHGPKRLPQEFKEIRKEWRARKKAEAEARSAPYKNAQQAQKNHHSHHHHSQFQAHRPLTSSSSTSNLAGQVGNPNAHTMSLMANSSHPGISYGNMTSNRPHTMMSSGPSSSGNLMNMGQLQMGRVLSTGSIDNSSLSTNMMTMPHGFSPDLLGPPLSSAPSYYASSPYAPSSLGSSQHLSGPASAPRHASMNYGTHLRVNSSMGTERNNLPQPDNMRSVSDNSNMPNRSPHDSKSIMKDDKKTVTGQYLVTAAR
ncbi:uncharacterized protein MELLADRAFT_107591 [Melampsora larici-populina 98AG31]|uniref:C2H2-type domain-containing protein n=1 Tax=Melampsora larici-populina (strain 98AG31 / pathotype 3-4-7) TaxID=747676 RepID=F4RQ51_MELLP|nr:uncharacterized protein MELLADRAFT_107591 [Melampsora larici-populina 98AG31]EGG05349.1 hypothetical protein MELLADRAFT_107591 [Melampsora larici-populina 98AG31]